MHQRHGHSVNLQRAATADGDKVLKVAGSHTSAQQSSKFMPDLNARPGCKEARDKVVAAAVACSTRRKQ